MKNELLIKLRWNEKRAWYEIPRKGDKSESVDVYDLPKEMASPGTRDYIKHQVNLCNKELEHAQQQSGKSVFNWTPREIALSSATFI